MTETANDSSPYSPRNFLRARRPEKFSDSIYEIAPNLLPHTGPSGGGDSKVDSETYPVADELAQAWYHGEPGSSSERWAFAFSANLRAPVLLRADVEKLV